MSDKDQQFVLEITQDDINEGERGSPTRCPVAKAMRRLMGPFHGTPEVKNRSVSVRALYLGRVRFWLPFAVIDKIAHYDLGGEMRPFSFPLTSF